MAGRRERSGLPDGYRRAPGETADDSLLLSSRGLLALKSECFVVSVRMKMLDPHDVYLPFSNRCEESIVYSTSTALGGGCCVRIEGNPDRRLKDALWYIK